MRASAFAVVVLSAVCGCGEAHAQTLKTMGGEAVILSPEQSAPGVTVSGKPAPVPPKKSPVDYEADSVQFNQDAKVITLSGSVNLKQDGRTLQADKVTYDLGADKAVAEGNVVVTDPNGDVHRAQHVELTGRMSRGLIDKLQTTMTDGSRVWAEKGEKKTDDRYEFMDAAYTACKPCATDPDAAPPWRLHAKEVDVRRDEQRVVYRHAWLDVGGVPVLYTPYFSHPDGTVTQKSGFLTPSFGWNSNLGGFYDQPYYWAISPAQDATISVMPTTKQGPMLKGQYRQRFDRAHMQLDGSVANSSRTDSVGNQNVAQGDELRGHLFAKAGWDINDLWRAGTNLQLTSDEQYLRQYDFSSESVLENEVYVERFEGADYANVKLLGFQDVRVGTAKTDQPNIWPKAEMSFVGDANQTLGGRWQWDSSFLSLSRDGSGQDVWRASTTASWERQDIAPLGFVLTSQAAMRADTFYTANRIEAKTNPNEDSSKQENRLFPSAQISASYPLQANYDNSQLRVEPVTTLYLSPDIDNDTSIPNEDSQDVQLNAGNLLEGNRFPGMDRIEDKSHVAYGMRTGLYDYNGDQLSGFVGQSYAFDDGSNPFPAGSGLDKQSSDYVGAINAVFGDGANVINYQVQLDSDSMSSQRHELYGSSTEGPVSVYGHYLYAKGVAGTTYADSREQIKLGSSYSLTDAWKVRGEGTYDLSSTKTERGLRRAIAGVDYVHDCYNVSMTADRQIANQSSGAQETTIMFRVGLKNLGEYETDAFELQSGQNP